MPRNPTLRPYLAAAEATRLNPLLPGRIDEEDPVCVLDVDSLRLVREPIGVRRFALRHALVVDAEEFPQPADLVLGAGQHREVRATQSAVGPEPGGRVAPRVHR